MFARLRARSFVSQIENYAAGAAISDEASIALAATRLWGVRHGFDCTETDIAAMSDALADVAASHDVAPDAIAQALFMHEPSLRFDWGDHIAPPDQCT